MGAAMTGFFPSALPAAVPAAVPTAAPPGATGALIGVQEAGFAAIFGQQIPAAPFPGLVPDMPALAEEESELATDMTALPEVSALDELLPEIVAWPDTAAGVVPADVQPKVPVLALLSTDHASNLLRVRLDGPHTTPVPFGTDALAPPQIVLPHGKFAMRPVPDRGVENSDLTSKLQNLDLQPERTGLADRPRTVDPAQPVPTAPAIMTALPVSDAALDAADFTESDDAMLSDAVAAPGDQAPVQTVQEARRGGHETVTLHRVAGAHPLPERQILAAISASPSGRTEILLDPQDLGRVKLSLEGDETALVLTIQADRVDTADLLRRNSDVLLQEFREAGYQNLTFSFSHQDRTAAEQQSAGADFGTDDTPLSADLVADISPRRTALGGLDLRL